MRFCIVMLDCFRLYSVKKPHEGEEGEEEEEYDEEGVGGWGAGVGGT